MKITRVFAALIASMICALMLVAFYILFGSNISNVSSNEILIALFILTGCWTGIFLLLKPNGFSPEDKIDVKGKDSDLE